MKGVIGIGPSLWHMATTYAAYIDNHFPDSHGNAPIELFSGSQFPCHKLKDVHTWGCPVYDLDPTLQQSKQLTKGQPRSRLVIFVGFSSSHESDVPLILNTSTGQIYPQLHVAFDDSFSTVCSQEVSDTHPSLWNDSSISYVWTMILQLLLRMSSLILKNERRKILMYK